MERAIREHRRPEVMEWQRSGRPFRPIQEWRARDKRITPLGFMRALRSMTLKKYGRSAEGKKVYRTLMAAGMHFMDRYNYDTERVRRCIITYSTPDGFYPFCTINCGPTYRPFVEKMTARPAKTREEWRA